MSFRKFDALRLVKLCLKFAGANQASQSGLENGRFAPVPGDSDFSKRVKFKTAEGRSVKGRGQDQTERKRRGGQNPVSDVRGRESRFMFWIANRLIERSV